MRVSSKVHEKDELPGSPVGDRVLLLPDAPQEESEFKIHIPDIAKVRPCTGTLLAAGLSAMDKLHDQGVKIGDSVIWGQYAGVIWEWTHIQKEGRACLGHQWMRIPSPKDRASAAKCELCGAEQWTECVILANVDDIQASVELGDRIRAGAMSVVRGQTADLRTQHFIKRDGE